MLFKSSDDPDLEGPGGQSKLKAVLWLFGDWSAVEIKRLDGSMNKRKTINHRFTIAGQQVASERHCVERSWFRTFLPVS